MHKEQYLISAETAKTISELGIRWKALSYWQWIPGQRRYVLKNKIEPFQTGYAAYNIYELGHIIPFGFFNEMKVLKLATTYFKVQINEDTWYTYISEAEARAHYLIHLVRSGKVKLVSEKEAARIQLASNLPLPENT